MRFKSERGKEKFLCAYFAPLHHDGVEASPRNSPSSQLTATLDQETLPPGIPRKRSPTRKREVALPNFEEEKD